MKRRTINFSVALCAVVIAHAALLWPWRADTPLVQVASQATLDGSVVKVAIMREQVSTAPASQPNADTPAAASELPLMPKQAAILSPATESLSQKKNDSHPLQIPTSIRLHYTLTKGGSSADAVLTWKTSTDAARQLPNYELTLEANRGFVMLLKQTSVGDITSSGLAPKRYGDKRLAKSEQATHFDAAAGTVTFSNNRPQAAWIVGSQDRMSMLVQLAAMVKGRHEQGKASTKIWPAGEIIQLPVASLDELELWQWEVQTLTPDDAAGTIKLLRRPRRAFDATIELWLAESVSYLPVRIRQLDSSGVTDQVLVRSEQP